MFWIINKKNSFPGLHLNLLSCKEVKVSRNMAHIITLCYMYNLYIDPDKEFMSIKL